MDKKEVHPPCTELLPELEKEQKNNRHISEKALKRISNKTGIPISRVYATASFYSHLHFEEQGKYIIEICDSPSCYLNGSIDVIKFLEKELKIKSGQTTKNKKFSIHVCSCIGCCNKAPAMMINKNVYGNLTKEKIKQIIRKCK